MLFLRTVKKYASKFMLTNYLNYCNYPMLKFKHSQNSNT